MNKVLQIVLLWVIGSNVIFASHVITSFAEFEIDSATNEITIEYHVVLDSTV